MGGGLKKETSFLVRQAGYKYMFIDAMPVVVGPDKKMWVFATTTKNWVAASGTDTWDAVYAGGKGWWDLFKDLPEPPLDADLRI
jgi:hypothetical protein